ncbi:twin-arginine translocase subunit TatC [Candidatus Pyrohabitans sp.]
MPLIRYLLLLRRHAWFLLGTGFAFFFLFFYLSGYIINRMKQDILPESARLIATGMLETVMVKFQIALVLTIIALIPIAALLILRTLRFRLRLGVALWLLAGIALLLLGFGFTYLLLLPTAVKVLTSLTTEAGILAYYSINQFIFFAFLTTVIFSLLFELPLVVTWLALRGLVSVESLKQKRKFVYVGIVTLAAVITADPTPMSQLLLSFPLIVLYEMSILVASFLLKIRE